MIVELHMLQNFAPSCLNRDDTNSPKECEFGGYRRARISSQCIKRAIRENFKDNHLLPPESLAKRTKLLVGNLTQRMKEKGKDPQQAQGVVKKALESMGLGLDKDTKTEYLLFLGEKEMADIAEAITKHWSELESAAKLDQIEGKEKETKKETKKEAKKEAKEKAKDSLSELSKEILEALNGGKAADLALFGRMLADLPNKNIDAACQVAHAISTNKVSVEFDFYTAVDDLKEKDEAPGAGMMGTVEFNSACYYRYANIDLRQLKENLGGDEELARKTVESFLRASVSAIPTGKQNSMAAQNPPSFVFAVVRDSGAWSLANAFLKPVSSGNKGNLVRQSISALVDYWIRLVKVYGDKSIQASLAVALDDVEDVELEGLTRLPESLKKFPGEQQPDSATLPTRPPESSFEELITKVSESINFD